MRNLQVKIQYLRTVVKTDSRFGCINSCSHSWICAFGNNQSTGKSDAIVTDSLTKDSVQKDSTLADSLKKENSSVVSNEESNNKETEDIKDEMQSKASVPVDTNVKSQQESNTESSSMGSVEDKAKQVIRGIYGNGSVRKQKLGNDYAEIQGKVNEMYRNGLVH